MEGNPTWIPGVFGSALEFNGTDGDYVNITDYKGINADGGVQPAFSVTNWFFTTEAEGNREMVTWGTNVGRQRLTWRVHQGRLRTEHGAGNLRVLPLGRLLVRNIAMAFDAYLPDQQRAAQPIFSRTV